MNPRSEQTAHGSARHDDAGWHVVITRPLAGDGESSVPLVAGASTHLALAVWDGEQGEVGSRKAWATWVPLEVAK